MPQVKEEHDKINWFIFSFTCFNYNCLNEKTGSFNKC